MNLFALTTGLLAQEKLPTLYTLEELKGLRWNGFAVHRILERGICAKERAGFVLVWIPEAMVELADHEGAPRKTRRQHRAPVVRLCFDRTQLSDGALGSPQPPAGCW